MIPRKVCPAAGARFIESLENRTFLSAGPVAAAVKVKAPATTTTVTASKHAAPLGLSVTLTVTVKSNQPHVVPSGIVELFANGRPIGGLDGVLTLALNAKGKATYAFAPGNIALPLGKYQLSAEYLGNGSSQPASTSRATSVAVSGLRFQTLSDGLEGAIVKFGHGKSLAVGDVAEVVYTGFLASTSALFDYSSAHAGQAPDLVFQVEANPEQVVPGFDQGVIGMQVGETRVLLIPADLGYGSVVHGDIPANSDLVFLITLTAIL
jgi:hypothetical protein